MAKFVFTELVDAPPADINSAVLGDTPGQFSSETDLGKAVKLGDANNYVACADGDDLEGFVFAVAPATYNQGYSFGSVQKNKRVQAQAGAAVGTAGTPLAAGDFVVANDQAAPGTAGPARIKKGTPNVFHWRVLRVVTGTGTTGDTVLLERV